MPEGDTIHRSATNLSAWLAGRVVTAAYSTFPGIDLSRVVGRRLTTVEAQGKHLVMTFVDDATVKPPLALHTHMRMTGSWHVYERDARWHKPKRQARFVITAGDRVAVCFNVPIATLDTERAVLNERSLTELGPDVLAEPLDLSDVPRRIAARQPATVGELLLDQRIVAGIGNVYRAEGLFLAGLDPWTSPSLLSDAILVALVGRCAELMRTNVARPFARDTGGGPSRPWVYGRTGRPCRRCTTAVTSALLGSLPRRVYWCPTCQPASRPS
jgi:endonuclease VIII